jgi:iron(III) transport system ATP-binding protein
LVLLEVSHLSKNFGSVKAADDVNVSLEEGEMVTLLGPSGCGKTTTLRCVAGLEQPDSGKILCEGMALDSAEDGVHVPARERNFGMVFQSYATWPHMTVFENVAYPLRVRRFAKDKIRERVLETLELVQLSSLENRYSTQLSGGQQQRVSLARALVYRPKILLLDEPLSNLDAKLRESMRFELRELQDRLGFAGLYVTHDQAEALVISSRVYIMNSGKIVQSGRPREIYDDPRTKFVADFLGRSNLLEAVVSSEPGLDTVLARTVGGSELRCVRRSAGTVHKTGDRVWVSIRPERVAIDRDGRRGADNVLEGTIEKKAFLGDRGDCRVRINDDTLRASFPLIGDFEVGEKVFVRVDPQHCLVLDG